MPERTGVLVDLMDSARWPHCARFDGGTQPCLCWFARQQREWIEGGNEWPDGEVGYLADWLEVARVHECNEPFDGSGM